MTLLSIAKGRRLSPLTPHVTSHSFAFFYLKILYRFMFNTEFHNFANGSLFYTCILICNSELVYTDTEVYGTVGFPQTPTPQATSQTFLFLQIFYLISYICHTFICKIELVYTDTEVYGTVGFPQTPTLSPFPQATSQIFLFLLIFYQISYICHTFICKTELVYTDTEVYGTVGFPQTPTPQASSLPSDIYSETISDLDRLNLNQSQFSAVAATGLDLYEEAGELYIYTVVFFFGGGGSEREAYVIGYSDYSCLWLSLRPT